ncbi:MAG: O-antigen ligase family protein [Ktedonobacteraceae bacterium]|nr:O-antigen ligase family protein [Ktedonobacteraceae bacterium]
MKERLTLAGESAVPALLAKRRRSDLLLFIVLFFTLFSLTPLLILSGAAVGFSVLLGLLLALLLAAAIIRWPVLGFFVLAGCALLVEQEPLPTPIFSDTLYVFHWPPQLEGFVERPVGLLALFALLVWLLYRLVQRQTSLRGGFLFWPFLFYLLCAIGGALYGLATGGNLKIIVLQTRPFWYMFVSYLLAYNLVTQKSHIRNFFWLVIASAGIKALQGLYIYLVLFQGDLKGHDTIMSHEESFFFAALLLLVVIFCLHHRYRPQLFAALGVLPVVLVAMVANQRRADYIALFIGAVVVWVLVFRIKPAARKALLIGLLLCIVLGVGYVFAFARAEGSFAGPARAVISLFDPSATDARDASSNLYRTFENNDLKYTVKEYPAGLGFGKPFLQPQPLTLIFPKILEFDPYYNYVPHNTIYWIWVDLGPIGYFALWLLIGTIVVRGSIVARQLRDPYLQVVAIYVVAITLMEVVVAFADYQLFFYRNVIYLGLLCGLLAKLPALDQIEQKEVLLHESAHGLAAPARSLMGSRHT